MTQIYGDFYFTKKKLYFIQAQQQEVSQWINQFFINSRLNPAILLCYLSFLLRRQRVFPSR